MANDPAQEQASQELILELNFVPTWARKPPGFNPYADAVGERERRPRDRDRREGGRRPRERRPGDRREAGRGRGARREGFPPREGMRRDRGPERGRDRGRRPPERDERRERLPIEVSFVPERTQLGAVVRQLHESGRAYPLMQVASLFLANPAHHMVKLEVQRQGAESGGTRLFQCKACRSIFLSRGDLAAHALKAHLGEFYEVQEIQGEPPAGNFICVGRCRLSGVLVGPPNYHGFNEKVRELHGRQFAYMPLEEYRSKIEMLRDPELIEKWKQSVCRRTLYRVRGAPPEELALTWAETEAHFMTHFAPTLVREAARLIVPAEATRAMSDGPLKTQIRDAWTRESRHPHSLALALRPAFRHMRLHLFSGKGGSAFGGKAGRGETFVTPIRPSAVDPQHAVATIREVLQYLGEHPGCTRKDLVEGLRPGAAPESREVAAVLNPLRWLIEKGHVVEFFNGTLAIPSADGSKLRRVEKRERGR